MPPVHKSLCSLSELEFCVSRNLNVGEDSDVPHNFANLGELKVLDADFVVSFDSCEKVVEARCILQ
jgi:hypothetical protein